MDLIIIVENMHCKSADAPVQYVLVVLGTKKLQLSFSFHFTAAEVCAEPSAAVSRRRRSLASAEIN